MQPLRALLSSFMLSRALEVLPDVLNIGERACTSESDGFDPRHLPCYGGAI